MKTRAKMRLKAETVQKFLDGGRSADAVIRRIVDDLHEHLAGHDALHLYGVSYDPIYFKSSRGPRIDTQASIEEWLWQVDDSSSREHTHAAIVKVLTEERQNEQAG